jgi:hypothetical protein
MQVLLGLAYVIYQIALLMVFAMAVTFFSGVQGWFWSGLVVFASFFFLQFLPFSGILFSAACFYYLVWVLDWNFIVALIFCFPAIIIPFVFAGISVFSIFGRK